MYSNCLYENIDLRDMVDDSDWDGGILPIGERFASGGFLESGEFF